MGDRDQGRGGHGRDRRDARDDLERDAGLGERERLLAAAAEHERVAALEPDDVEAGGAVGDEQARHRLLLHPGPRDHERVVGRLVDELLGDERVGDEHVARADELEPAHGDQPGVARARADEVDGHPSSCATSPAKYALRSS